MSGFLSSCRLLRRLPAADRLLLSPGFQELRKIYSRAQLLTALEMACEELRRERGIRAVDPSQVDLEILRQHMEEWLSSVPGEV